MCQPFFFEQAEEFRVVIVATLDFTEQTDSETQKVNLLPFHTTRMTQETEKALTLFRGGRV